MAASSESRARLRPALKITTGQLLLWLAAGIVLALAVWRIAGTLAQNKYGINVWILQEINGSVQGSMYALIALG